MSWNTTEKVSVRTTKRILNSNGLFGRISARKPYLNKKQQKSRLAWCKSYIKWEPSQWKKVVFSDKCRIELISSTRTYVRRLVNTRFLCRYSIKTIKYGKKSLMMWGAINSDGRRVLVRCPERLDSIKYQEVLSQGLSIVYDPDNILMQDGATCHTSISTINYLQRNNVTYISDWPAQSERL